MSAEEADDGAVCLAAPPIVPVDIDRFTSNELFGEPGIYPDGSPMAPAAGDAPDEPRARAMLVDLGLHDAARAFDDPVLVARAPDPVARAGLAALAGTISESLLVDFAAGRGRVQHLTLGVTAGPGRVVGPPANGGDVAARVVNDRYRAEHPALFAASLAHDLLWSGVGAGQYEECILHALGAMVHVQLIGRVPQLASLGTELARRQNSLAVTLLNSRHPGSADISLIAPDGPGTIPGGSPRMQTPDFWSIPFVPGRPRGGDAPSALAPVLRAVLAPGAAIPSPLRWSPELGDLLSAHLGRVWLPLDAQLVAVRALGLVA